MPRGPAALFGIRLARRVKGVRGTLGPRHSTGGGRLLDKEVTGMHDQTGMHGRTDKADYVGAGGQAGEVDKAGDFIRKLGPSGRAASRHGPGAGGVQGGGLDGGDRPTCPTEPVGF